MKHRLLYPVDTRGASLPCHYDQLQAWIETLPKLLSNSRVPCPKAALLVGMPGVGKGSSVKVIARILERPLFLLDGSVPLNVLSRITLDQERCVLWVDRPGEQHSGILRWLQTRESAGVLTVFTTDSPHKLPPGFARTDIVATAWHLDLPNMTQRNALWGEMLAVAISGEHDHDSVKLGQLSPMFSPAEIRAALDIATRECGGIPKPGALIDSVLSLKPLVVRMDEHLACIRAWAHTHACSEASSLSRCDLRTCA